MSKKHFIALAAAFLATRPSKYPQVQGPMAAQWEGDVYAVAGVCGQFNDAFNRDRFLAACGLGD